MPRPRKPTGLKLLHGDFDKDPQRQNHNEPTPEVRAPSVPSHLPQLAKNEWKRVCAELKELGVLSRVERAALEQYCRAYAEWRIACKALENEGRYLPDKHGVLREHPAGRAMRGLAAICQKALSEFGMTPSSRTRLHVAEGKPEDEDAKRFFG